MLLMAGCVDDDDVQGITAEQSAAYDSVGQPVLFTSGNEQVTITRAGVPYMAKDGRFVCTMYYHPAAGATDSSPFDVRPNSEGGTMATAWLKVNNTVGNAVYRIASFDETQMDEDKNLHFDNNATMFYWQNRLTHAFLALADYNKLSTNVGATTNLDTQGKLKLFPWGDYVVGTTDEEENVDDGQGGTTTQTTTIVTIDPTINVYDLTRGTRNNITDQPDPILALTIQKPQGATQEANRVRLYFKHQFSQIQVNLKGASDNSATIESGQIEKVELLGVSTEGYVKNVLNADGTVGTFEANSNPAAGAMNAASAMQVNLEDFTDEQIAANKWGTSFLMFDMASGIDEDGDGRDDAYATGYLKSYNAIAFGELWGIRVTWKEKTGDIRHVSTFEVPLTNEASTPSSTDTSGSSDTTTPSDSKPIVYLRKLQSGYKYIYNLELRRGTLAIIRTQIEDWKQEEPLVYGADGTITN